MSKQRLVEERLPALFAMMSACRLCPRRCGVNRLQGQTGFCRTANQIKVASWAHHHGEEPPISGTNGSGTIFSSGCTLGCLFCQNFPFSQLDNGRIFTAAELGEIFTRLAAEGVHNLNFVTPTHVLPMLLDAWLHSSETARRLPLVYNCSGYESPELLELLAGIIDIYLPDIKYADNAIAARLSQVGDYVEHNRTTLKAMFNQVGQLQINSATDLATRGMIVRHLILPENLAGSADSLRWLRSELGPDIHLSIMCQYFPAHQAHQHPTLKRPITEGEYLPVLELVEELGFNNVWAQDPTERGGA
ncbi:MAG TPA: radical SAM protein [Candidatus Rifleibacterium sp.]|nr:radical SAM protein [Candidatus Rifleibacterium sp.]HPT46645.1 radical SAM protein [Candidatus Rifleibacterium sp.]